MIDAGCDVEAPATGEFSYGKTPLFFAVTRCRDATVLALLERGAATKIVNNKGQSVRALARSHLKPETYAAIVAAEATRWEAPTLGTRRWEVDPAEDTLHPLRLRQFKQYLEVLITRPMWQAAAARWHGGEAEEGIDANQARASYARVRRRRGATADK